MVIAVSGSEQHAVVRGLERVITWTRRMKPPEGMSASTFTTLDTLTFAGPVRISDLAGREGMTQPGMTALVNRLEAEGLAVRAADPTDGRAALVSVTEAGRHRVARHRAVRADLLGERLSDLAPSDHAALVAALPALERLTYDLPRAAGSIPTTESSSVS